MSKLIVYKTERKKNNICICHGVRRKSKLTIKLRKPFNICVIVTFHSDYQSETEI